MGRDLCWYVLPVNIEHDTTKPMCLGWDFQHDEDDVKYEIYEKVCVMEGREPDFNNVSMYRRNSEFNNIVYEYQYGDKSDDASVWCPKCKMFANGIYDSSLVVDSCHVQHSYSNPIWNSDWNVKDLYLGSSMSAFVKRFCNHRLYREVTSDDVDAAYIKLERLGEPLRKSDKEAHNETLSVLEFLKRWTSQPDYVVIMHDEY